ncbi:hypothetical protein ACFXG4_04125 [Nocardia sp. NPDC059246]|uniref:hypothetical protein n=1 Tax=unclassified Nocardia TaxID=2637762 RepID=UPI00368176B6
MSIDARFVYIVDSPYRPAPMASDRVTAYDSVRECPDYYPARVSLKRILMELRHPMPGACSWWRFDVPDAREREGIELLDIAERDDLFGEPCRVLLVPRRCFLRFGNEWIRLAADADTHAMYEYSTLGNWVRVHCEGPMPDGWVLDMERAAA